LDIRKLILDEMAERGTLKVSDIVKITGYSRKYVHRFFYALQEEGRITLVGKANTAHYLPKGKTESVRFKKGIRKVHRILKNKNLGEDLVLGQIRDQTGVLLDLKPNVRGIVEYAFSEMLNNAIEHSQSQYIDVWMARGATELKFNVTDRGVGIYNNIMEKKNLANHLEAIQDLLKGKETTAPAEHSGEGIFFTSKAADWFSIRSSEKELVFDNLHSDLFIKDIRHVEGTKVSFLVELGSDKRLLDIFREYTDEAFDFSQTEVHVRLYKEGVEYLSRSQARRIFAGLDKFKTVTLDFRNVQTVGQAFADEIFRVWKSGHPNTRITPVNTCENVDFMIKRALSVGTKTTLSS